MSDAIFVVFGATGPVGTALIQSLVVRHPEVTIKAVSRSGPQSTCRLASMSLPNVSIVAGDVTDAEQCLALTVGAERIYCAVGFPNYEVAYWAANWPVVIQNLLAATKAAGALFVFADNLYAYGPGSDISSSSPTVPASMQSKPGIRSTLRNTIIDAMQDGTKVIAVGSADFFGPHVESTSFLGDVVPGKLAAGQKPLAIGSATVVHDFCYVVDLAEALSVASDQEEAVGRFWIAPHCTQNKTITDIGSDMQSHLAGKREQARFMVLAPFVVKLAGLVVPFMREVKEMLPFWTMDYVVRDDTQKFTEWGMKPTDYETAIRETMDHFTALQASKS